MSSNLRAVIMSGKGYLFNPISGYTWTRVVDSDNKPIVGKNGKPVKGEWAGLIHFPTKNANGKKIAAYIEPIPEPENAVSEVPIEMTTTSSSSSSMNTQLKNKNTNNGNSEELDWKSLSSEQKNACVCLTKLMSASQSSPQNRFSQVKKTSKRERSPWGVFTDRVRALLKKNGYEGKAVATEAVQFASSLKEERSNLKSWTDEEILQRRRTWTPTPVLSRGGKRKTRRRQTKTRKH